MYHGKKNSRVFEVLGYGKENSILIDFKIQ